MQHVLLIRIATTPLSLARLHGVLRARRTPFAIGYSGQTDDGTTIVTVILDAEAAVADHIARHCRRLVDVHEVREAAIGSALVHETHLVTILASEAAIRSALQHHPAGRLLDAAGDPIVALSGTRAEITAALAALAPLRPISLVRGAPVACIPAPHPTPALPEESS